MKNMKWELSKCFCKNCKIVSLFSLLKTKIPHNLVLCGIYTNVGISQLSYFFQTLQDREDEDG